jgi:rRNA processing protein Krr1/Pno1
MDVYVLSSQLGIIGVFSTLNAAKSSVEMLVWDNPEDRVFHAHEDWGNLGWSAPIYTIQQMKLK